MRHSIAATTFAGRRGKEVRDILASFFFGRDYFSTSLLYSKFQNHDLIKSIGESVAKTTGVPFWYRDYRTGWNEGIQKSKKAQMYRQQYCGCIYSEKERYYKPMDAKR